MKKQSILAAAVRHTLKEITLRLVCWCKGLSYEALKANRRKRLQDELTERLWKLDYNKTCYPTEWYQGMIQYHTTIYHYGE